MGFLKHFRGVRFKKNTVFFPHTDLTLTMDRAFFKEAWAIGRFNTYLKFRQFFLRLKGRKPAQTLGFYPQPSGPWYNAWLAAFMGNVDILLSPLSADTVFVFDDKTAAPLHPDLADWPASRLINAGVLDISKRRVGRVFEAIFGYNIAVDPLSAAGPMVEKSDGNGRHDGRVVVGPLTRDRVDADCVYQRLIDSTSKSGFSEDLRIAYVGGEIALVYHKYKALDQRFGTTYAKVIVKAPDAVFSAVEIEKIIEFCGAMGLEFGAVDLMRDKHDGRIYAVDVNKTCMPVLCLSLKEQIDAFQEISAALLRLLNRKAQEGFS